jgi:acetate kinase
VRILAIATNEEVAIARASFELLATPERLPS